MKNTNQKIRERALELAIKLNKKEKYVLAVAEAFEKYITEGEIREEIYGGTLGRYKL